jgi:hypothetical protein
MGGVAFFQWLAKALHAALPVQPHFSLMLWAAAFLESKVGQLGRDVQ